MPRRNLEAGTRPIRAEWIQETDAGETPDNPAWARFSDIVQGFDFNPSIATSPRRGLGVVDPIYFPRGTETHEVTVTYDLQQVLTGGPLNAGLLRDADNQLPQYHSILVRESRSVDGGVHDSGVRIYTHLVGALIGSLEIAGNVGTGEPLVVTLNYQGEKGRSYVIDEPATAGPVTVNSTDAMDAGANYMVTIEGMVSGALMTEELQLNGTTDVTGADDFATIDAVRWTGMNTPRGDIIVEQGGQEVARLLGTESTGQTEADEGVPLLGTGSHGTALGTDFYGAENTTIQVGGAELVDELRNWTIRVDNGLGTEPVAGSRRQVILAGARTIELDVESFGSEETHDRIRDLLTGTERDITINVAGGGTGRVVTLTGAEILTGPSRSYSPDQSIIPVSSTLTAKGISIS